MPQSLLLLITFVGFALNTGSSLHCVCKLSCCQESSRFCKVASSPLITNHQRTTLSFLPVLNFRLIVRSLTEMFVAECMAFLTAETVVDLRVPQTFLAPEIGDTVML